MSVCRLSLVVVVQCGLVAGIIIVIVVGILNLIVAGRRGYRIIIQKCLRLRQFSALMIRGEDEDVGEFEIEDLE